MRANRGPRALPRSFVLLAATTFTFCVLVAMTWAQRYAVWLTKRLSNRVEAVRWWRAVALVAPLLPAVALVRTTTLLSAVAQLAVGAALIEAWAISLQTQCWIAAYQPELIPTDAKPLGAKPYRSEDRRLHWIFRTHLTHALPIAIILALTTTHSTATQQLLIVLFALKYFGYASPDFEACVHWDMHCGTLDLSRGGRLRTFWRVVLDFVLGPMNGYVPRVYDANHLLIHHRYNSGAGDIHSVLSYERTSFVEFSVFAVKMCGSVMFGTDLILHPLCRGRARALAILGITAFWCSVALAAFFGSLLAPVLTFFALCHAVGLAKDQWVWHGLVARSDSNSPLAHTVLWVPDRKFWRSVTEPSDGKSPEGATGEAPDPEVAWAFYDNLHLLHHMHSSAGYTEYPRLLRKEARRIALSGASVLEWDIYDDFVHLCWTGRLDRIADALVEPSQPGLGEAGVAARLRAVPGSRRRWEGAAQTRVVSAIDHLMPRILAAVTGSHR